METNITKECIFGYSYSKTGFYPKTTLFRETSVGQILRPRAETWFCIFN